MSRPCRPSRLGWPPPRVAHEPQAHPVERRPTGAPPTETPWRHVASEGDEERQGGLPQRLVEERWHLHRPLHPQERRRSAALGLGTRRPCEQPPQALLRQPRPQQRERRASPSPSMRTRPRSTPMQLGLARYRRPAPGLEVAPPRRAMTGHGLQEPPDRNRGPCRGRFRTARAGGLPPRGVVVGWK